MNGSRTIMLIALLGAAGSAAASGPAPGDTLDTILLPDGYTATVLCTGIPGADGLATGPSGELYVAAEAIGAVFRVEDDGAVTRIADGLRNPEGLAVDSAGVVYVTEDVGGGRVLAVRPSGSMETVAEGLQYPEGIALTEGGDILVTESGVEESTLPPVLTGVRNIRADGGGQVFSALYLWSFSGIVVDDDGMIYVTNETSGFLFMNDSVIRIDPSTGESEVFARGLRACEGICATPGTFFPLYVAEEDVGDGTGRVSMVFEDGSTSVFASGFGTIEDVLLDDRGRLFVSDDSNGMVVLIQPSDHLSTD